MSKEYSKQPRVDLIIPVYNVAQFLTICLESVVKQTYKNINVILVDDGSTDESGEICDDYASRHENIVVVHQKNAGLSGARNTGIRMSSAPFICFLDSDDWLFTNTIEILMTEIAEADADISLCRSIDEYTEGGEIEEYKGKIPSKIFDGTQIIDEYLNLKKGNIPVSAWGKVYRRELFSDILFPVGELHEDLAIMIDILKKCNKLVSVDSHLWHYRQRLGSITKQHYRHANFALYKDMEHIKSEIAPSNKTAFDGFYAFNIKSLISMFNEADKEEDKQDYDILRRELRHVRFSSLLNPTLSLKDKISILLADTTFHKLAKKIYFALK
jgi:glycosyltransferase involved in cell wall biosynthesis